MASAGLRSGGCFVVGLQFMDGVIQTDLFVPNGTLGKKRGMLVPSKSACCIENKGGGYRWRSAYKADIDEVSLPTPLSGEGQDPSNQRCPRRKTLG